jgi:hypothetical protein
MFVRSYLGGGSEGIGWGSWDGRGGWLVCDDGEIWREIAERKGGERLR